MTFDIILHHKAHFVIVIYFPLISYIVWKWPDRSDILIISILILPFVFTVAYWDSTIYTINYCYMIDDCILWDSLVEIPIDETHLFEELVEELVKKP